MMMMMMRMTTTTLCGCTEFNGQQIRSTVILNRAERSAAVLEEDSELKGPVVRQHTVPGFARLQCGDDPADRCDLLQIDRRCVRCNKDGMVYHTRQMRSADEGQTVFFTCIHCR